MAPIYNVIGGEPAVAAAVDDLYARTLGDPALAHYFAGTDMPRQKATIDAIAQTLAPMRSDIVAA